MTNISGDKRQTESFENDPVYKENTNLNSQIVRNNAEEGIYLQHLGSKLRSILLFQFNAKSVYVSDTAAAPALLRQTTFSTSTFVKLPSTHFEGINFVTSIRTPIVHVD